MSTASNTPADLLAAALDTAARGWPVRGLPKELKQWIEQFDYRPTDGAKSLAIRAVRQVRDDSELAELWKENAKEAKKWQAGLDDLIERLKKAPQQRPAKKPKPPAPTGVKEAIKRLKALDSYIQLTPAGHAKYVHIQSEADDATPATVAVAHALPALRQADLVAVGGGHGEPRGTMLACGPGTGFGAACLHRDVGKPRAIASEAGHMRLGAATAACRTMNRLACPSRARFNRLWWS